MKKDVFDVVFKNIVDGTKCPHKGCDKLRHRLYRVGMTASSYAHTNNKQLSRPTSGRNKQRVFAVCPKGHRTSLLKGTFFANSRLPIIKMLDFLSCYNTHRNAGRNVTPTHLQRVHNISRKTGYILLKRLQQYEHDNDTIEYDNLISIIKTAKDMGMQFKQCDIGIQVHKKRTMSKRSRRSTTKQPRTKLPTERNVVAKLFRSDKWISIRQLPMVFWDATRHHSVLKKELPLSILIHRRMLDNYYKYKYGTDTPRGKNKNKNEKGQRWIEAGELEDYARYFVEHRYQRRKDNKEE